MNTTSEFILRSILIGGGATLAMDLWAAVLRRFGIPSLNYCLLGRWFRHMPAGTFRHANINAAQQKPFECTVGWIGHYAIDTTLALGFLILVSRDWLIRPTVVPALLYGVGTTAFPFRRMT